MTESLGATRSDVNVYDVHIPSVMSWVTPSNLSQSKATAKCSEVLCNPLPSSTDKYRPVRPIQVQYSAAQPSTVPTNTDYFRAVLPQNTDPTIPESVTGLKKFPHQNKFVYIGLLGLKPAHLPCLPVFPPALRLFTILQSLPCPLFFIY